MMHLCMDCGEEFSDEDYPECLDCGCPACGSYNLDDEVPAVSKHWKVGLCWDCEHGRAGRCGQWMMTRPCAVKSCGSFEPSGREPAKGGFAVAERQPSP
jgi:DNA-directed RNA polymerase subunit RPC12/RpoP